MDTLKLMMYGNVCIVPKNQIKDINNGKALTTTGRWFDIICDCIFQNDYEIVEANPENDVPESYIVCNICNRVHFLSDLRNMQDI